MIDYGTIMLEMIQEIQNNEKKYKKKLEYVIKGQIPIMSIPKVSN